MDEFKELYENLSPNKLSIENVTQLETKVEVLEQEVRQLEAALNQSELDKRNLNINYERDKKNLVKNHESLLANISALFKTAKKEIERKNNTIKELRQQLDDFIFRRNQRRWPQQNEVVQSQNEDDVICAKPVTEDRPVASVIRPTARNHVFSDREKSSSGDKSPLPARTGARHHENVEKDKRVDSSRVKCAENTALEGRLKDYNELKFPHSTAPEGIPDDYIDSKNSTNLYPSRRSDKKIGEADDREHRIRREAKERHRYSPYEHRKEDHERSKCKHRRRERDPNDEEYSKSRAKRSPHDRDRHEFGDGYRTIDFRKEVKCGGRKTNEDRRSDHSSRATSDDRRRDVEFGSRNLNDDRRREDLAYAKFGAKKSIENRKKEDVGHEKSMEERRRESPATLEFGGRHLNDVRRKEDLVFAKSNARKSLEERSKEDMAYQKVDFAGRKSVGEQRKEDLVNQRLIENQRPKSLTNLNLAEQKLTEDRRRENVITQPEHSGRKSVEELRKENPAHLETVAKKPPCDQKDLVHPGLATKKLINNRKRDFAVTKLGGQKSIVDRKRGNPLDPKHVDKKSNENRQSEDANSSQNIVDHRVPSGSHVEGGHPVEGQMKAVDILAQYGVYATPYKLLNGDKCTFSGFKLVSPIADTPDHLKALFNDSKVKVSPIPMINERRVLDGFNSPVKKPVTPAEAVKKDPAAVANKNSNEVPPKKTLADNSLTSPSPSKLLLLNTVTTSPFKNCCIVKVSAEVVTNSPAETAAKEPVATVSGTDTTNAEHGVFTRKRRAPVIRHVKKAES